MLQAIPPPKCANIFYLKDKSKFGKRIEFQSTSEYFKEYNALSEEQKLPYKQKAQNDKLRYIIELSKLNK